MTEERDEMSYDLVPGSENVPSSRSRRSRLCSFFTRGSSQKALSVCRRGVALTNDKRRLSRAMVGGQTMTRQHYP